MSTKCLFRALKATVGNPQGKLVLIILADISNEKDQCWPSHQYIADRAECSKRSVFRYIKELETAGHITVFRRSDDNGKSTSSLYTVHPKAGVTDLHPSEGRVTGCHGEGDTVARGEGDTVANNTPTLSILPLTLPIAPAVEVEDLFDRFYEAYPKKVKRESALIAFKKHKPDPAFLRMLLNDIYHRLAIGEWLTDHRLQYIPGPAPYLNGKLWENAYIPRADFQPEQDFSKIAREAQEI